MKNSIYRTAASPLGLARLIFTALIFGACLAVSIAQTEDRAPKININTANAEALQYIPGIGPKKAADILALREQIGSFKMWEDLLGVSGIGERTLLMIKKYSELNRGVAELTEEMAANPPREKLTENPKDADS